MAPEFTSPTLTEPPATVACFLLFRVFATKLFAPCFSRLARELDPMLPVNQALYSIETGVDRLSKLVEKKVRVRKNPDNLLVVVPFSFLTTPRSAIMRFSDEDSGNTA